MAMLPVSLLFILNNTKVARLESIIKPASASRRGVAGINVLAIVVAGAR